MTLRARPPVLREEVTRAVEEQIAAIEARRGVQIVCAVYRRSDTYPEAPWRAFAAGAVMSAGASLVLDLWRPAWVDATTLLFHLATVLGAAGACAVVVLLCSRCARSLVPQARRDLEVSRRAKELFVTRALFATESRRAILVFTSLFERKVEIIADRAFEHRVNAAGWSAVIAAMAPRLREASCGEALLHGLATLDRVLEAQGFAAQGPIVDEIPNALIQAES
ncbi:MAG: hypothetical protein M3Z31_12735 [Pseudomonadota bacterium]|nr:hypothetical protein [Pseudomonadota bacterium]